MNRRAFLNDTLVGSLALSAFSAFPSEANARAGIHPPDESFLTGLPRLMELATLPGIGVGVVRPGKPVWQQYSGVANAETKTPISADSLFPCCSLGKPVFACVVLKLAEEGKIDLDRPLNEYLKDDALTGQFGDRVTGGHVLSHSTGLDNWRWEKGQQLTPRFEPGTKFGYSGEGFYHLQRVVEGITGVGCEAFMQERIFKPLGMDSSTYLWRDDANEHLVAGHKGGDPTYNRDLAIQIWKIIRESKEPLSHFTHERIVAALVKAGGAAPEPNDIVPNVAFSMLSTVSDYVRFLSALIDPSDRVLGLSAATRKAMQTPVSHITSALSWGLGIGVDCVHEQ